MYNYVFIAAVDDISKLINTLKASGDMSSDIPLVHRRFHAIRGVHAIRGFCPINPRGFHVWIKGLKRNTLPRGTT